MRRADSSRRRAMTLIELLLALGLIVLVMSMMFMFYDSSLRTRAHGSKLISDRQISRLIARKIADEVRSANGFVPSLGPGISGDHCSITIQTVTLPGKELMLERSIKEDAMAAECDLRHVQYYLAYDEDETFSYPDGTEASAPLGLVRREIKTLHQVVVMENARESVDLDLLSKEMLYVRFRYFDGVDWVDKWDIGHEQEGGLGNSLPQAVEVTVGYGPALPPVEEEDLDFEEDEEDDLTPSEPEPYSPQTFTVTVQLPQADTFFGSRLMRAQKRGRDGTSNN